MATSDRPEGGRARFRDTPNTLIPIGPVTAGVEAPPALVYQMLSAIGQGAGNDGERAEVVERADDGIVYDFWSRISLPFGVHRLVRTRERVTLRPPEAIEFEHLDGPLVGLRERITVHADPDGGTRLEYAGTYRPRGILARIGGRLLARPVVRRVVREHFEDIRQRAEARANRSRVFPREAAPGDLR